MKYFYVVIVAIFFGFMSAGVNAEPLKTGQQIPDTNLKTQEGESVKLRELVKEKPAVIVFYRGGWCPYCTKHLSALAKIEKEIIDAGYQILAISPDSPEKIKEMRGKENISAYTMLSDSDMQTAQAFGIAFQVPAELVSKYKNEYKIDLEAASGGLTHHQLPHPAVYVVGTDGVIRFAHVNEDYKSRLEPEAILKATKTK